MDYSKIKLSNERNSHVTKRLNRLSTWKFFKVIYRENLWRLFGYNFLMLLCMLPVVAVMVLRSFFISKIQHTLPLYNGFGFSTGAWFAGSGTYPAVADYFAAQLRYNNTFMGGMMVVAAVAMLFVFSGGFAVIRDAFWTGKLSAVGVFKSMWMGLKANFLYAFVSIAVIASSLFGIYELHVFISGLAGLKWLAIVLTVLLSIVELFLVMYLMILCSVSVTYKQSVADNLDDAWRLMWLNVLPNIIHLLLALIPIALYFVFSGNFLFQLFLIIILMFGGMYFPLVWQTHMMKTFALFHPVEVKKKKKTSETKSAVKKPSEKAKDEQSADEIKDEPLDDEPQEEQPQEEAQGERSDEGASAPEEQSADGEANNE